MSPRRVVRPQRPARLVGALLGGALLSGAVVAVAQLGGDRNSMDPLAGAQTPLATVTIGDVPADHWARDAVTLLVRRGLLSGYPDGTFRGNNPISRYEAAQLFARFLLAYSGNVAAAPLTSSEQGVVKAGIASVGGELKVVTDRIAALSSSVMAQDSQIKALQAQSGQDAAQAGGQAQVIADLKASLAALRAQLDDQQRTIAGIALGSAPPAPAAQAQAPTPAPAAVTTPAPATDPSTLPDVAFKAAPAPQNAGGGSLGVYAGLGVGSPLTRLSGDASVLLGVHNLIGNVGAQVSASYRPAAQAVGVDGALTYAFGVNDTVSPYVGLGYGVVSSPARANRAAGATDSYALGLVGLDYSLTPSLKAFAQGEMKYYLSNAGYGTALAAGQSGGLGGNLKVGLKIRF